MDFSLSLHEFWIPLGQILLVNIVLSGDNAVVIALAARSLPPKQQKLAIFLGVRRRDSDADRSDHFCREVTDLALLEAGRLSALGLDRHPAIERR